MAGDWIPIRIELWQDEAVISMAHSLKKSEDEIVGMLVRCWGWFNVNTKTGNAPSVTKTFLDRYIGVSGFCDSMAKEGWLVIGPGGMGVSVPLFDEYNSKPAKERKLGSKRVMRYREAKRNASSVTPAFQNNEKCNASTVSKALPEREKRESIEVAKATSCDGPAEPPQSEKPRDEIWDAVQGLWFPSGVPPSQRSRIGKIVRDLKSIGASIEAIYERQKRMRDEWGDKGNTPESMVKHWDFFGPDRKAQGNSSSLFGKASTEADSPARIRAAPGKYANIKAINASSNGQDGS